MWGLERHALTTLKEEVAFEVSLSTGSAQGQRRPRRQADKTKQNGRAWRRWPATQKQLHGFLGLLPVAALPPTPHRHCKSK